MKTPAVDSDMPLHNTERTSFPLGIQAAGEDDKRERDNADDFRQPRIIKVHAAQT